MNTTTPPHQINSLVLFLFVVAPPLLPLHSPLLFIIIIYIRYQGIYSIFLKYEHHFNFFFFLLSSTLLFFRSSIFFKFIAFPISPFHSIGCNFFFFIIFVRYFPPIGGQDRPTTRLKRFVHCTASIFICF